MRRRQWHPTHSSTFACKVPWPEEPGRLQSMGSLRVRGNWVFTFSFHFHALEKEMATHSSVIACRIPGTGVTPVGCRLWGHTVRHDWSDLATAAAAPSIWTLWSDLPQKVSAICQFNSSLSNILPSTLQKSYLSFILLAYSVKFSKGQFQKA